MNWLNAYKHLLPSGRAWRLTHDTALRRFFNGLTGLPASVRSFFDDIFDDLDPQLTRELDKWEAFWGLPSASSLTEQERRNRLDATWKALGGQDPDYIQTTLRAAGFDVYVHEYWEPVAGRSGGSVDGDITPTVRNPFTYIWDGVSPREFVGAGHDLAYCGGDSAFCNSQIDPPGYPLVNKVIVGSSQVVGSGHVATVSGGVNAASGAEIVQYGRKQYVIPPGDPDIYPYFLYIGGETFPDVATIPAGRKDEFEDLCLKICPLEQWLGILVTYS